MKKHGFSGWNIKSWAKGNKETLKILITVGFGFWVPATAAVKLLAGTLLKLALDSFDYLLKKK